MAMITTELRPLLNQVEDDTTRLWLAVLIFCFFDILYDTPEKNSALDWIQNENNYFFNQLAYALGYDPDSFRKRIQRALKKIKEKSQWFSTWC